MAKKKTDGSNLGLIITLVFFVLTTVILGVTTYMGYSEQGEKETAKKKAEQEKGVAENDAKWNRMKSRVLTRWIGKDIPGVEATEISREMKQFEDNQFPAATGQKDKDDFAKVVKELNQAMPWDAGKDATPSVTYEQRVAKLNADVAEWKAKTKKAEEATKKAESDKKDAEDAKDKEIADRKSVV